ncbi:hypothetical protein PENARI_c008G00279 [Penicillium arizonense]|uniref:Uncharacterized protein n=1 Tax=Penicillium arizonense TaxID=1835702 RepID=A0A1F5LJV2_PENAI|nr:hypothetical protein PENARI_c008G00279 [Penicillium arizonense]OGE53376.1 hypothetical protein PENARI_c008G00279 [Penicillium arizonense]
MPWPSLAAEKPVYRIPHIWGSWSEMHDDVDEHVDSLNYV